MGTYWAVGRSSIPRPMRPHYSSTSISCLVVVKFGNSGLMEWSPSASDCDGRICLDSRAFPVLSGASSWDSSPSVWWRHRKVLSVQVLCHCALRHTNILHSTRARSTKVGEVLGQTLEGGCIFPLYYEELKLRLFQKPEHNLSNKVHNLSILISLPAPICGLNTWFHNLL